MNRSLQQQLELTLSLAKRNLKARYQDSLLGFLWSLVRPALLTFVLWLVFTKILPMPFNQMGVPYWLHVLISILGWNFILGSITDATQSVTANANLLKKVHIHAEVFPIAAIISNGVHFALALLVVLVYVAFSSIGLHLNLLLLPAAVTVMVLIILGVSLFLSALNVHFRDIGNVIELAGLAFFYISPVIYPVSMAFAKLESIWGHFASAIYMLNPVAPALVALRRSTIYSGTNLEIPDTQLVAFLLIAALIGSLATVLGWIFFRRLSRDFADQL